MYNEAMSVTGTIFDVKKFAIHDGPGIRTTVFFKGCPLNCWWCQNPEGLKLEPEIMTIRSGSNGGDGEKKETVGRLASADEVVAEIKKDIVFYDQSGGGVTFSGGEPLLQVDFLTALLTGCREAGIHTAVDTSGHAEWAALKSILRRVDLFLYDLKLADDEEHQQYTGVSNALLLENLDRLSKAGAEIIIRIPLIPGITDTASNLEAIAGLLMEMKMNSPVDLLPYNKIAEDKFRRFDLHPRLGATSDRPAEELEQLAGLFESKGHAVNIGG
jgi:pyruvate formate lyase activating enzyme